MRVLDDDVIAGHEVPEDHASTMLDRQIALGASLGLARQNSTPYYRYMASFYGQCNWHVRAQGQRAGSRTTTFATLRIRDVAAGSAMADLCCKHPISAATYCARKGNCTTRR